MASWRPGVNEPGHPQAVTNIQGPVALYFQRLDRKGGGAERMLFRLAEALTKRGCEVHLVSWDNPEATGFYAMPRGVQWHRLGFARGVRDKLRRAWVLSRVLRKNRVANLIGFVMSGDMTVYAGAKLSGVRILAAERNGPSMYRWIYSPRRRRINFALLRLADTILVQSPDFVSGYPEHLRHRIKVIPNPVYPAAKSADPAAPGPDGRFVVLAAGRLDPVQKRPQLLVQAFARLAENHPTWDLHLLGDGPAQKDLERLIAREGLGRRIQIQPTTHQIEAHYGAANLYVMPSAWEGFPNALAEAMSHGLPAIGIASGEGVAELVRRAGGWVAEDDDDPVAALVACLDTAMSDAAERGRRGVQARAAMSDFDPDVIFDRWMQVLADDRGRHA